MVLRPDPESRLRYNKDTLTQHLRSSILFSRGVPMSSTHTFLATEPALFNPETGRLDAARIARELNVPVGMIAEAIGRKAPGVRKHPDASSLQAELRRIYRIWVAIVDLYAGDKTHARIFLNAPNRNLENRAPIEFIENGDLAPLELFVDAMSVRQPA
jgi:hypothetical protein